MSRKIILSLILIFIAAYTHAATTKLHVLSDINSKPIPPGFNFPTSPQEIQHWITNPDNTAIRAHAWDIGQA